ncbi:MAG: Omp28-related outer membrane protein [Ignavibacteriaceae bacterium]|nr:Omp28-related outer membrane protein [Ignavibacteriaceae bacterium]MCW9097302.1 Omp28-related outer membrane protein [Ignavibacteriaceae bacterium]
MKNKLRYFVAVFIAMVSLLTFSQDLFAQTQRNPVLEEFTGTWCPWCPCGHTIMEQILASMPNAILIGYHGPANGSDPFSFFSGNSVIGMFGVPYWPSGTVDRTGPPNDRGTWQSWMNTRYSVPATVSIDVERSFNKTTREFDATIDFKALTDLNGQYNFTVILLESGIVWAQSGNGSCPGATNYVHKHVVRDMMNGTTGQEIINGSWNTNQVITKTLTHTVPLPGGSGPDMVWDSCDVVVIVSEVSSAIYNSEIQQAVELELVSPDYLATISSLSPDVIIENNGTGNFSATVYNQGLMDDSYYVDVTMTAPNGWTGEYTTPNGTFPFGTQDLVAVSAGDSLPVDLSFSPNFINGSGEATIRFTSMNEPNIFVEKTFRMVTITGVKGLIIDASGEGYADLLLDPVEQVFEYPLGIVTREALYPGIDLTNFALVCWSTGNAYPVLTEDEVDALMPFLDNGGRLLINGQNIGEDIFGASGQSQFAQDFYHNYLHADYVDDVGLTFFFRGIDGDPISGSHLFGFSLSDLYTRSPDQFIPYDASAATLFTFGTYSQYNSIRADDGVNRVVYFGLGLEQVSVDTTRDGLITRAVNWLMNDFVVSTPNENISPVSFNLSQNYPNPFNPTTTITYSIPKESQVNLKIYDVMGREVAVLVNGKQQAGAYEVKFDAASLASGTYFYKLTAGDFISVKKMALLK